MNGTTHRGRKRLIPLGGATRLLERSAFVGEIDRSKSSGIVLMVALEWSSV